MFKSQHNIHYLQPGQLLLSKTCSKICWLFLQIILPVLVLGHSTSKSSLQTLRYAAHSAKQHFTRHGTLDLLPCQLQQAIPSVHCAYATAVVASNISYTNLPGRYHPQSTTNSARAAGGSIAQHGKACLQILQLTVAGCRCCCWLLLCHLALWCCAHHG